jgi:hypothetical protein
MEQIVRLGKIVFSVQRKVSIPRLLKISCSLKLY